MKQKPSPYALATQPKQPVIEGIQKRPLAEGGSLQMAEYFFEAGVEEGGHSHKTDEVGYVVTGEFEIQIGEEARRVGPGDAYTLPAGVVHTVKCTATGSYILVKLKEG